MPEPIKIPEQPQKDPYEAAYLDAKRFPLTTQKGLSLQKQKMIDAINMDDVRRMAEEGRPLNSEQEARAQELRAKAALRQPDGPPPAA